MIFNAITFVVLIASTYVAYQRGRARQAEDSHTSFQEALHDQRAEFETALAAKDESVLLYATHAAITIDALDTHVAATRPLSDEHQSLIEAIRPYYSSETIH